MTSSENPPFELLILPGNHPGTGPWALDLGEALARTFGNVWVRKWLHWDSGDDRIDVNAELERIDNSDWETVPTVLGKSAGVLVALRAIVTGILEPQRCIFIGTPLMFARSMGLDVPVLVHALQRPTLFIQQTDDPGGSFATLSEALGGDASAATPALVEVPGEDHRYDDVAALKTIIREWARSTAPAEP